MVLHSAVARVGLVLLKAHPAAADVVDRVAAVDEAVRAAEVEAVVDAAEMVVEVVAAETEAGEAHAITHFWYSTGPGAT